MDTQAATSKTTDIRLRQLSYSSRLTLHACPRKFQLYKLNAVQEDDDGISGDNTTFAFGHAVGQGIQSVLEEKSDDTIYFDIFRAWDSDLLSELPKKGKSFWLAVHAVDKFKALKKNGFLKGWKLAQYKGRPAAELSFIIKFPDGYTYKGFVDAVLVHEKTGEVMVLEVKTTGMRYVSAASYKNSAQAVGYSIVLDALFPGLSSYTVKYMIYMTLQREFEVMDFKKDYLVRALWIRELMLDIEIIKIYEKTNIYPMHGESCLNWGRECEYFNICTLSTATLTKPLEPKHEARILHGIENEFEIKLELKDLIAAQLAKE